MAWTTFLAASLLMTVAVVHGQNARPPAAADRAQPPANARTLAISTSNARKATVGPPEYFTGTVRIEMLVQPVAPARLSGASVTFEPRARTAWHAHPLGQTLIVTAGTGWVQQESGARQSIKIGDVVWTPPGVKHWHGASVSTPLTHLALHEALDGKNVQWMGPVSDAQYSQ